MRATVPAPLLLAAALASGCGDTLVDHAGGSFVSLCQGTISSCGAGPTCLDCADPLQYAPPANGQPACGAVTCDFTCDPGWLRCGAACCRALSVAAGWYHTCAILGQPGDTSGRLACWGANNWGQLGDGDVRDSPVPADVAGLASGVTEVAAGGYHTCAIQNGTPYCWGWNDAGQVGAGTTLAYYPYPQPVEKTSSGALTALAPGGRHTCAVNGSGEVWCWGANERGQIGQGTVDTGLHNYPLKVPGLSAVAQVAAGRYHTCARAAGAVSCWGADDLGEIGDGLAAIGRDVPSPTAAGSFTNASSIVLGYEFSLAITPGTADPQLWGWGSNADGELGSAVAPAVASPTLASAVAVKPAALSAGRAHTCALSGGGLECFGADDRDQLGAPGSSDVAVSFGVASPPVQVSAGYDHTCAVLQDGSLWCWGQNDRGQVGNGLFDLSNPVASPTLVSGR